MQRSRVTTSEEGAAGIQTRVSCTGIRLRPTQPVPVVGADRTGKENLLCNPLYLNICVNNLDTKTSRWLRNWVTFWLAFGNHTPCSKIYFINNLTYRVLKLSVSIFRYCLHTISIFIFIRKRYLIIILYLPLRTYLLYVPFLRKLCERRSMKFSTGRAYMEGKRKKLKT